MKMLALDVGSSSVKSAILKDGRIAGRIARAPLRTRFEGVHVEIDANLILRAIRDALRQIGRPAKSVDVIGLTVMAPSWVALDKNGRPLTLVVTHQDRRSIEESRQIEQSVGHERHMRITGNRPFPGGISSTTWKWFLKHAPDVMKKADLCGHLSTLLHRQMTGSRVIDPSNASFTGLYSTLDQSGWSDEMIDAVGINRHRLPQVIGAEGVGGLITRTAATRFDLTHGTPMLVGCMDGSAAALLAGNEPGQLVNVCGSTDVLALVTDRPRPHENLLTRAVGVGRRWVSVSTLAAAGSALDWAHATFFQELSAQEFRRKIADLSRRQRRGGAAKRGRRDSAAPAPIVQFENYLAGSRTSLEQRTATLSGLTLSTTRDDILAAIVESLARVGAERLALLREVNPIRIRRQVLLTGGVHGGLADILHRDWPGQWKFAPEEEATLRGVGTLAPQEE